MNSIELNLPSEIAVREQDRRLVVRIQSSITVENAMGIGSAVLAAWDERRDLAGLVLDLSGVRHIDSSGIGMLLYLARNAKHAGLPFGLCCLEESPRRLLARTRLGELFRISPTLEDALQSPETADSEGQSGVAGSNWRDEHIGFELGVKRSRELAAGVNFDVSGTDVVRQRFDGWVQLLPERRRIWLHGQGVRQPVVFYSEGDDRPRELVVTRITSDSVTGYLRVPREIRV